MIERLHSTIAAVCPIDGVRIISIGVADIQYAAIATQAQKDDAASALATFDWSEGAHDNWSLAKLRSAAKQFHTELQAENRALRATVKLVVDELNILRQWVTDLKAATEASTTLANFKTGVAALPNTPQRTYVQARNAIETLIDGDS